MKKAGNVIFWVVVIIAAFFIINNLYHRFYPNAQLKRVIPDEGGRTAQETTLRETSGDTRDDQKKNPVAPDFTLSDITGKDVKLSDFRGKIVILNFWATWCPYCVDEMPDLDELSAELGEKGDAVILAINEQEDRDTVIKFMEKKKFKLNVLMDTTGSVGEMYGASSIPITYVIDREGRVYGYIPGATNKKTLAGIVNEVINK